MQRLNRLECTFGKVKWVREVLFVVLLFSMVTQLTPAKISSVHAETGTLMVFGEAASFARLDNIDPSGWFYQAVLYNPTNADIVVDGLRWWYNGTAKFIEASTNAQCCDSRYFSVLPTTNFLGDRAINWEYPAGSVSITVPPREVRITWIEVPTRSINDETINTFYYVEAHVGSQWLSSTSYLSHSGQDAAATTLFRADFNLTTSPSSETQTHPNPQWLYNEDRYAVANTSTRVRLVPVTMSRNSMGINAATITVTLPINWHYTTGTAHNPYNETIVSYTVAGKDELRWNLTNPIARYAADQSIDQNYIEFNVTAPYSPDAYNFTIKAAITSLLAKATIETQDITAFIKTPPTAIAASAPRPALTLQDVSFNGSDSFDPDGQVVTYFWQFGDGENATGKTATHAYADDGNYTAKLTVTDDAGFESTGFDLIEILNRPPTVQFTKSAETVLVGTVVLFNTSESSDPDGAIMNFTWDFGDGNITTTSESNITHVYIQPANFNVTLTAVDNDGQSTLTWQSVYVDMHDVAVVGIDVPEIEVQIGATITINVTVQNRGTLAESFNVSLFCNGTEIATQEVLDLSAHAERVLAFNWNTASIPDAAKFSIQATASGVPYETDAANNNYTDGSVNVIKGQIGGFSLWPPSGWVWPLFALPPAAALIVLIVWKRRSAPGKFRGIEYLDEITDGPIPDGFSVLVSGQAGSGKSVLSQELTYRYLEMGKPCVYATYDCFPDEIRHNIEKLHLDLYEHEVQGKFMFIDCYSSIAKVESKEKYSLGQPFSLADLGIVMSKAASDVNAPLRMFLDSVVPLFTHVDPQKVVEFLQDRSARIKGVNGVFVFTVGRETIQSSLINRLEEVVDCVIELDVTPGKDKPIRKLRVKKMRGRNPSEKWVVYEIDPAGRIVFQAQG